MKPTPTERHNLVDELKSAREVARVSKTCVARRAGVSRMQIGRVENGERLPSSRVLLAYASLCNLDSYRLQISWGIMPKEIQMRLCNKPDLITFVLNS